MTELDVIIGGGEVGSTIYEIINRVFPVAVVDLDIDKQKLPDTKELVSKFRKRQETRMLHICIPFKTQETFVDTVVQFIKEYNPEVVVIHSTVSRGTTRKIAEKTDIAVVFSAARGVHSRFMEDMEYYTKFWAISTMDKKAVNIFRQAMSDAGFKLKQMSKPETVELAKLLTDTTYYGLLISYAQRTKMICDKYGVDYDEMWQFAEEPHSKLGNRPKMFPGYIGGHCVIPNLSLLDSDVFEQFKDIKEFNEIYKKHLENEN